MGCVSKADFCPHAVEVALATDRLRVLGMSEGAIVPMDMIAAHDAASQALARLGKRCSGGGGSPLPMGKERVEESEGRRVLEH